MKLNDISRNATRSEPSTISGVNNLPEDEKRQIYKRIIPQELLDRFSLPTDLYDHSGKNLLSLSCPAGSSSTEMYLYHDYGFRDPVLYGHITDTINGQIHVLLYVLNDPHSPRFDIDLMPDGTLTQLGVRDRNLAAELEAMQFGLAPGQIRKGLQLLSPAIHAFERFVLDRYHEIYFVDPLYYHNAVIFERQGFAYQRGRRLMQRINNGFQPGGDILQKLDGSNPYRQPEAASSIRLRSWAIHDNILDLPFDGVTMYKIIGKQAGIRTCPDSSW